MASIKKRGLKLSAVSLSIIFTISLILVSVARGEEREKIIDVIHTDSGLGDAAFEQDTAQSSLLQKLLERRKNRDTKDDALVAAQDKKENRE